MESSLSDIQELYRTHVHEKRILQGNIRDLDRQKLKSLKHLSTESKQFRNKYTKYIQGRRRNSIHDLPMQLKPVSDIGANGPIARDLVCNNCPYSFKTWNHLVDIDRGGIDCYRSEILFGDSKDKKVDESMVETNRSQVKGKGTHSRLVTEIPGFRRNLSYTPRLSASASALTERKAMDSRSPKVSPRTKRTREMADLRQFSTASTKKIQEASISDIRHSITTVSLKTTASVPSIKIASVESDIENLANQDYYGNENNVENLDPFKDEFHRGRSHTIDNHEKPALLKKRCEAQTQVYNGTKHRSSLGSVTLKIMAGSAKGLTKFKYLTKLLNSLPVSGYTNTEDNDTKESECFPDIFESIRKCRYLRSPPTSRRGSPIDLTDEERFKW